MKKLFLAMLLLLEMQCTIAQQKVISNDSISFYFNEIKFAVNKYKKLWDIDLYGPILIVDPYTRKTFAN